MSCWGLFKVAMNGTPNCGLRLGWLINPQNKQVEIYRAGQEVEVVAMPVVLSGEEVLPGFSLEVN
jgi:Uma2 family endonuclease